MMGDGFGHGFGGGLWMVLVWLVPILLLIWGASVLRGGGGSGANGKREPRSAREILDEEYARGKIDREEYQRRKQDLSE